MAHLEYWSALQVAETHGVRRQWRISDGRIRAIRRSRQSQRSAMERGALIELIGKYVEPVARMDNCSVDAKPFP